MFIGAVVQSKFAIGDKVKNTPEKIKEKIAKSKQLSLKPFSELLKPNSEFLKSTSELNEGFPKQPAVNLTNLMVLALIEADSKGMPIVCKDAYKFVNKRFPFYDVKNPECSNSWKNSIRHTLNVVLSDRKILTRQAPPKLETECNCLGQCKHNTGGKTIYSYGMYSLLILFL